MTTVRTARKRLLEVALAYPDAWLDHPWGEDVVKIRKKIFAFLGVASDARLTIGVKLPSSVDAALTLPNVERSGYGLGKAGWVSAVYAAKDAVDLPLLLEWLEESYRTVAPKTLVKGPVVSGRKRA